MAANVLDFVGYGGSASCFEGAGPTSAPGNTTAVRRGFRGCTDNGNNAADFATGAPNPRNSASPTQSCVPTPLATHEIQGSGRTSPHDGELVSTSGIVTGRKSNGFFIQASDDDADDDSDTSEGVFVFTSSSPAAAAAVGNAVSVVGFVEEFIPSQDPNSPPMTEITGPPIVNLLSTGNALPAAVTLTVAAIDPAGSIEQHERLEGMRVHVDSLTAVSPTMGSINESEAVSTTNGVFYAVITGVARPFREPGIQVPEPLPPGSPCCIPSFDANPERLRVDSDAIGAAALEVTSGAVVTGVTGPLDYAFRTYTILPDPPPALPPLVSGLARAVPVRAPAADEFTVGSFNMERFFDTEDDSATEEPVLTVPAFDDRLNKASLAIRDLMRSPDILGVQEVENLPTLQALADRINADTLAAGGSHPRYAPFLFEGNDIGGIDSGFLVKGSKVTAVEVDQEGKDATFIDPNTDLPAVLHDRPPVVLRAAVQQPAGAPFPVTVIVNHHRSLSGINSPTDGHRVRTKRRAQAEDLANLIQDRQTADPGEALAAVGDFNAFQFSDGYVDVVGTIKGTPAPADQVVLASSDLVNPDLVNLVDSVPAQERYSFSFDGSAQVLDHVLVNSVLLTKARGLQYARGNMDSPESFRNDPTRPERLSDHDMPVAYFCLPYPPPVVSASLTPVGRVRRKQGTFRVGFSAADNCEPAPAVLAVMAIPPGAERFRVVFGDGDDDDDDDGGGGADSSIIFDFARRRITLEGRNRTALRSMLARMLADGGAAVAQGQLLRLQLQEPGGEDDAGDDERIARFRFDFRGNVLVSEKAPSLVLRVSATDDNGNKGVATAVPVFAGR
jgi:predicted extracellular nuclease